MSLDVERLLEESGVVRQGHFVLSSGRHSGTYLQCALALQHPELATRLGAALGELFANEKVQAVAAPALGGILVAHEVARRLEVRGIFAERQEGGLTFRRGFHLEPGERVLVVEDVVTTGGSVREVVELVRRAGAVPVGIGAIVDRSGGEDLGVPFRALIRLNAVSWAAADCPLCRQGLPTEKPGSRHQRV
ncbi:MAG: orotate phosphoribosyltransferase [Thermaerobacter sp.]|nr:orotate phosphoribosyltransferase [Thermaerobacter sp.]